MNTGDKFTEYEWIVEPIDKHDVIEIVTGKLPYGRVEQ